ncbi:MAG TPA: GNAT family N-acetyltransferase [Candidatus Saccharimonadia bacterium]
MTQQVVTLATVPEKDKGILSKLLHDYQLELIPYNDGEGHEEATEYKYLPDYFTDPNRSAFFILRGDDIAGFVLVNTHTLIEPHAHSIAEFYVAPPLRHSGVGERAAMLTFEKFPGRWEVAQMEANQPAIAFWRKTIYKATGGQYTEAALNTEAWHGPVQIFDVR